jgi:hypothetical protein
VPKKHGLQPSAQLTGGQPTVSYTQSCRSREIDRIDRSGIGSRTGSGRSCRFPFVGSIELAGGQSGFPPSSTRLFVGCTPHTTSKAAAGPAAHRPHQDAPKLKDLSRYSSRARAKADPGITALHGEPSSSNSKPNRSCPPGALAARPSFGRLRTTAVRKGRS